MVDFVVVVVFFLAMTATALKPEVFVVFVVVVVVVGVVVDAVVGMIMIKVLKLK